MQPSVNLSGPSCLPYLSAPIAVPSKSILQRTRPKDRKIENIRHAKIAHPFSLAAEKPIRFSSTIPLGKRVELILNHHLSERKNLTDTLIKVGVKRNELQMIHANFKEFKRKLLELHKKLEDALATEDFSSASPFFPVFGYPSLETFYSQAQHIYKYVDKMVKNPRDLAITILQLIESHERLEKKLEQRLLNLEKQIVYKKGEISYLLSIEEIQDLLTEVKLYNQKMRKIEPESIPVGRSSPLSIEQSEEAKTMHTLLDMMTSINLQSTQEQ
ncbi:hypothetical protein [Candidatus Protochlamydia phocaeensis]|uniref:hypothetical protein n=1 Tax=Candidatus Protochlamydia phocaeensis TaxID=1414722 RepID=UPI000837AF13|nr:hypothetical protein [Candidatus Protochlamydia phocaeensis]